MKKTAFLLLSIVSVSTIQAAIGAEDRQHLGCDSGYSLVVKESNWPAIKEGGGSTVTGIYWCQKHLATSYNRQCIDGTPIRSHGADRCVKNTVQDPKCNSGFSYHASCDGGAPCCRSTNGVAKNNIFRCDSGFVLSDDIPGAVRKCIKSEVKTMRSCSSNQLVKEDFSGEEDWCVTKIDIKKAKFFPSN